MGCAYLRANALRFIIAAGFAGLAPICFWFPVAWFWIPASEFLFGVLVGGAITFGEELGVPLASWAQQQTLVFLRASVFGLLAQIALSVANHLLLTEEVAPSPALQFYGTLTCLFPAIVFLACTRLLSPPQG